jgi:UDP-GlcNAc:undecaprenyl-phosphate/decaprenyl-phosphate GlcNAc-1-phosphate transferase
MPSKIRREYIDNPATRRASVMRELALNSMNAWLLSIVLITVIRRFCTLIGLVDIPAGRKQHQGHIPLVGAAVFAAFAIATLLLEHWPVGYTPFLLGLFLLVALGVVDDLFDVRAAIKLFVQTACVACMVLPTGLLIRHVGIPALDQLLALQWAIPVTIIAMVGLINGVNMMDGIDGLAGSLTLVSLFWLGTAALVLGLDGEFSISVLAAFCVIGFLGFNLRHPWRNRAGVFLGDGGSMMLGAILGYLAISISQRGTGPGLSAVAVIWVCAIPIVDTLSVAVRRLSAGRSPLSSDRMHLHHLMLDAGFTESQTVIALSACATVLGAIGVMGWRLGVPDEVLLLGFSAPIGLHVCFTLYGRRHLRMGTRVVPLPETAVAQRPAEG